MRLAPALVLASLLAGPAWAQDATTPAAPAEPAPTAPAPAGPAPVAPISVTDIGPNADRDFWCALAYSLTARAGQLGGDQAVASAEAAKSQILFGGLVALMQAGNFQEEQFNTLTGEYTVKLLDPFAAPQQTREECEAAVPEAQAAIEAAQAAAPAQAPAPAPDAAPAPAEPATPDAPAAGAPAAQ